jgi:hypothetical protein
LEDIVMFRSIVVAFVLGSLGLVGCGGVVEERVVVREPVAVVERAPAAVVVTTRPEHRMWEPAHWEHRGHQRVWVEAHWRS